jgi:hypothetical protein
VWCGYFSLLLHLNKKQLLCLFDRGTDYFKAIFSLIISHVYLFEKKEEKNKMFNILITKETTGDVVPFLMVVFSNV